MRKLAAVAVGTTQRGISVFRLNIGQPDLLSPALFLQSVRRVRQSVVSYAPSQGLPETIRAWQRYYRTTGISLREEDILVTVGGSEAIIFALLAVTDPGDEALIFEPTYPSYISMARMLGVRLRSLKLDIKNNFHLPGRQEILKAITPRTKVMIVCNPSNPTGTVFTNQELRTLAHIAQQKNMFVIADETYREIVLSAKRPISMASIASLRERVILVDSVSKRFNLCGARIGCIASPNRHVMASALKFAQSRLSAPTIDQLGVIPLLEHSSRHTRHLVREYRKRRDAVVSGLRRIPGARWYVPEGAFYIMAEFPVRDIDHFSRWLLEKFHDRKETVMLAPGTGFYSHPHEGKHEARIAYVLSAPRLKRAMEVLAKGVALYTQRYGKV